MVSMEADYVVIGAGAMGMAFIDEILTHSDATVALVDRRGKPGGHWNDAYPFVRLHQPSFFYGVSSTRLGSDRIDEVGSNAGLSELASGAEVIAYFDQVMQRRFLPSGRVQFLPATHYEDGTATVLASGESVALSARRAVVDATYMNVTVPAMRPPAYSVDDGCTVIPPNLLPSVEAPAGGFVVVGAGKTAFDALLWLLDRGVDPGAIRWIVPRDSWLINRSFLQPGEGFRFGEQVEVIAAATSGSQLFLDLEAAGQFLRIDPDVEPTMYRCATVTDVEVEALRRIDQVVRMGRVQRITSTSVELDEGTLAVDADTVFVDCSADGLERRPVVPVFGDGRITLQTVRACQQVFSAALIARIETLDGVSMEERNELATVIPHPDTPDDFLTSSLAHFHNVGRWSAQPEVADWLATSRLSPGGAGDADLETALAAVMKLESFVADA